MEELEDRDLVAVTNFINLMDNHEEWLFNGVSEDAVLDWFGRSVLGRKSIVRFIRTNFSRMQHTIENIQRIPPLINHRLLNHFVSDVPSSSDKLVLECGQGDCLKKITPKNLVRPNLNKLLNAPRKKSHQQCSANFKNWQFVEIIAKLTIEQNSDEVKHFAEKSIRRIVLGYSDEIHFIVYEPKRICRKKLSMCNV